MSRYLGLDLGGTNIKAVVLDNEGPTPSALEVDTFPTRAELGPESVVKGLIEVGSRLVSSHGPFAGIGLGVPGLFDRRQGTIELFPNLPGPWRGQPVRDQLEGALGHPVTLINDARAFSLAEARLGAGRGCRVVACLTLGTGIGGGIVLDDQLQLGAWGVAGEIGHQTVVADGPPCGCGNRGCLEAVARSGVLAELAGRGDAAEVYRAAAAGDARSQTAIETVAEWLAIGIANVIAVLGPDRVVVGGGLIAGGEQVLGPIRAAVRRRVTLVPADEVQIVPAALGPIAGAIGAALAPTG